MAYLPSSVKDLRDQLLVTSGSVTLISMLVIVRDICYPGYTSDCRMFRTVKESSSN